MIYSKAFIYSSKARLVRIRPAHQQELLLVAHHQWERCLSSTTTTNASSASCSKKGQPLQPDDSTTDDVSSYLQTKVDIDIAFHDGILDALKSIYGNQITISNLESFGKEGLKALAASVEQQEKMRGGGVRGRPRPRRKVTFDVPHHQTTFELDWRMGDSLLDVAMRNPELLGEYLEGACGGKMSCCTCHVYLNKATLDRLPKATDAEKDMLDLAFEPRKNSRLGCQVQLQESLLEMEEPVVVTIPSNVNNVWK